MEVKRGGGKGSGVKMDFSKAPVRMIIGMRKYVHA